MEAPVEVPAAAIDTGQPFRDQGGHTAAWTVQRTAVARPAVAECWHVRTRRHRLVGSAPNTASAQGWRRWSKSSFSPSRQSAVSITNDLATTRLGPGQSDLCPCHTRSSLADVGAARHVSTPGHRRMRQGILSIRAAEPHG